MKALTAWALAVSMLGITATSAQAQPGKLFFESDIVVGDQEGVPGPGCVLQSRFKRLEKVVWRVRVLDQAGNAIDNKGLKSLEIQLPDGQKIAMRFGPHPPPRLGPTEDHYWVARWIIPMEHPSGTFAYKVVATTQDGNAQTWEPFKLKISQLTVIDGAIDPPKQKPKK